MEKIESNKLRKFLKYQLPAILWITAIFIQSSISKLSTPDLGFKSQDKLAHLVEFAILAFLLRRAFFYYPNAKWREKWYLLTLLVGGCYAVFDEIHQAFVPGRTAVLYDVLADVIGVLIVINIYRFLKNKIINTSGRKILFK